MPKAFGDLVTCDSICAKSDNDLGIEGSKVMLVFKDRGTSWVDAYATPTKQFEYVVEAMHHFTGPFAAVKLYYSDNAPELIRAARECGWPKDTSTPGVPENNGVAENAVKYVLNGTRTTLLHAGFTVKWWPIGSRHFCFANNTTASALDNSSAWKRRFGGPQPARLQRLPFGCIIDFKPSPVIQKATAKFEPRFVSWLASPLGGSLEG